MKNVAKDGEKGMSKSYLLDTNIVSAILKKNEKINQKMKQVRRQGQSAFISGITYYEVKRGLLASNATRKLLDFDFFCRTYRVLPVEIEVLEKASEIHAELKGQGRLLEDADILIAATAIAQGLILVSHDRDMQRVTGITIEDWLE
ncbi:MAG: type II toxin-antitoxin system VapC family toxin [Hormoscilla sp.]